MRTFVPFVSILLLFTFSCKGKREAAAAASAGGDVRPTTSSAPAAPASSASQAGTTADSAPAAGDPSADDTKAMTTPSGADTLFFSLERTPCFGRCPTYKYVINDDGKATYHGIRSVDREGFYTGQVDRATMDALYQRAVSIGFFGLQDKYDSPVTDLPSTIIHINANGKDKQVVGRSGTPQPFKAFAVYADSLLSHVPWVKVEEAK